MITERAAAKLNLTLHLLSKRADGYHALESLIAFTDLVDRLEFRPASSLSLKVEGPFARAAGVVNKNSVLKAAQVLQRTSGATEGAEIILHKAIPVGAGLGGGSADAAAALRGLNTLWQLELPVTALQRIGTPLGADVPACLHSTPLIATGIGDKIVPSHLPDFAAVLVYPNQPLLTRHVYESAEIPEQGRRTRNAAPADEDQLAFLDAPSTAGDFLALVARLQKTRNDLQRPAITLMPAIAEILVALETTPGPTRFCRMSGSGSSCFALVASMKEAEAIATILAREHPEWWVRAVKVNSANG